MADAGCVGYMSSHSDLAALSVSHEQLNGPLTLAIFFSFCRDILGHSSEKHEGLRQIRSQGAKINKRPSHFTDAEKSLSA